MYRQMNAGDARAAKDVRISQIFASSNHTIAISVSGILFSWGYKGKGLLGREITSPDAKESGLALPVSGGNRFRTEMADVQKEIWNP